MGKRGPKAKSDKSKTRRGNPGRRPSKKTPIRERPDRKVQQLAGPPAMPRFPYFNDDARRMWRKMVAIMVDRLTITPDTGPLLELFCLAYADHQAARRELLANGSDFHVSKNGYKVQHAAVAVARQHGLTLERLADKLGFAPQTRETIDPVAQSRQKSAAEEWEERRPDTSKLVPFRQAQR